MATRWEAASAVAIAFAVIAWPVAAQDRPLYISREAVITAAVVLTGFTKPAGAGQASAPQLAVGIQDEANVPARILTVAQAEVARVFRRAGVETISGRHDDRRSGHRHSVRQSSGTHQFDTRYDRAGDGELRNRKRPACIRFLQPHRRAQVDDTQPF